MEKDKKLTFFRKLKISITDFEKYQDLAAEKILKTLVYVLILMIIFNIVVAGIYTYKFSAIIENAKKYINDNIETVQFENNKLNIIPKNKEEVTTIESSEKLDIKIIINTQTTYEEKIQESIDEIKSENNGILILSDRIVIKNGLVTNPYSYTYESIAEEYNINYLDKQELLNLLSGETLKQLNLGFFGIMYIYMFTIYISSTLVDIFVLSILAFIVTLMVKMRLKFTATYNIAAYSLTLPIILNLIYFVVNSITGFTIQYFEIMYTGIACIYIIAAILMIKSDVIKREIELTKIIEQQDIIRAEMERKEEEQREQEEKERQKREEEKERKQKEDGKDNSNKKKGDIGKQPEGNNA